MTRALMAATLLAAAALQSLPAAADNRLVERLYNAASVVRVEGRANVQSTIQFDADETIENVAIGDSQSWQVTPNKRANLLFVKPLADRASTNMTVVTSKRTYLFDLVASPAHRSPVYILSFTYPKEEAADGVKLADGTTAPTPVPNADELAAANDAYSVIDPATLNFAWAPKGKAGLLPARVFDDGWATYLTWSAGTPLPAILIKDFQGTEGPVNFSVRGDVIVVDGVPREIVLRSGKDSATLINNGPVRPLVQPVPLPAPAPAPVQALAQGAAATIPAEVK